MLNKRERYNILEIFRICCNLGQFPLEVDLASLQLKIPATSKKRICAVSYCFFVLHILYKNGSLAYACFFVPDTQLHQLVIHGIVATGSTMCAFWYYVMFVSSPGLFTTFVETTLLGHIGGPPDMSERMNKEWKMRLKEYSLQDLITIGLFYMVVVCAGFIVASFIYDPTMRLLLYAALPQYLQNWATCGLCLIEEIRFVTISVSLTVPIWQLQVISFDLVCNQLQRLMRAIQNGRQSPRSVYRYLRCLQLYLSVLNNVNSYLIFTWKLVRISICTISGYAAIAHFHEYPLFGTMYYLLLIDATIFYAVIYEQAFKIPQLFREATACARLHIRGNRTERPDHFRKQMRSVPRSGIKVGQFHRMERESTLNFMNYVVVHIVNMLVAYMVETTFNPSFDLKI